MAHELTFNQAGVAEVFSVRETPWHREGHILLDAPTFGRALELGGLDFEVVKRPLWVQDPAGGFVESSMAYGTFRLDRGTQLGTVTSNYQVVQNRDAFAVLEPLVDQGLVTLETGGSLREGADCWLLVKFNLPPESLAGEQYRAMGVQPFGLVATNHSGRRGVLVAVTPIRVICANTLGMAEGDGVGSQVVVQHRGAAEAKVVEAAQGLFGDMVQRFELAAAQYAALRRTFLDLAQFRELVGNIMAPDPREHPRFNPEAKLAELVVGRYEAKVDRLVHLWDHGAGHTGDRSAWEAYNAAVEAVDHNADLWPVRGGAYRTASLLGGRLGDMKRQVLDRLLAVAQ